MDHFPASVITGRTVNSQPLSPLVLLPSLGVATPALSSGISAFPSSASLEGTGRARVLRVLWLQEQKAF